MLRGRFGDTTKRPYLEGRLVIPRLKLQSDVSFLVDTGADETTLLPADGMKMGFPYDDLSEGPRVAVGIGGTSRNFIESAAVVFSEPGQALHVYGIMLQIVRPEQDLMDLPSLLGRDILNNWRMHYSPPTNRLAFEVVTADRTVPLSD